MNTLRTNVNGTNFERNCLLKYIVTPFEQIPAFQWHQNLWQVPMLASLLGRFGYNVDVIGWNATALYLDKQYDLLLDISPHNRNVYEQHLRPGCPQILYATGAFPAWQREREEERLKNLHRRRGVRLEPRTPLACQYPYPDLFHAIFLVGNRRTLATFGEVAPGRIHFIKNSGYTLPPQTDFTQKSPRDFLFFASQPQVIKGLDLLLEAFASVPAVNLYVCSLFRQEADFCKVYHDELYNRPNIKSVGFINMQSESFWSIVRRCSYVILPSCSEGISGSVLAAMSAGLIPIVSEACGLEEDEAHFLEDCSIECIRETIRHYAEKSAGWLRSQSFRSLAIIQQRYNPRHYIMSVHKALTGLLGNPSDHYLHLAANLVQKGSAYMIANTRVGIPLTGGKHWYGGVSYIEMLVRSLSVLPETERPQMFLVITERSVVDFDYYRPFVKLFNGVIYLGPSTARPQISPEISPLHCQSWDEMFSLIDFYYPVNSDVLPYRQAVSWIPDFQHQYLKEYFSSYEYQAREKLFQKIAAQAGLVIVNSRAAEADFRKHYPDSRTAIRVLSAYPYPSDDWYHPFPEETQRKYQLPDRFVLCSNQFWVHKNHSLLFQAIAIIKEAGIDIHLVCTGQTTDYRSPGYYDTLQNEIDSLGIRENISILGLIPRADQIQLLRRSLFVVQPSLFEGLSLVALECRALGKPIVLSDLAVHEEYRYGTVFNRRDPVDLAQKMARLLSACQPGPDKAAEADAKAGALQAVEAGAREFCDLVLEHLDASLSLAPERRPAPAVTVLTSFSRENIANQQTAIRSWQQCGFKVIALNSAEDIATLQSLFPSVEYVTVSRDAGNDFDKPFVYIDDLLACCARQQTAVCGIVKSDIIFSNTGLTAFVAEEAVNSIVFGSRMDADSPACNAGTPHGGGFDYIFFDKRIVNFYPPESFCLGLCWWDYWLILMALAHDIRGKRITTPVAWHINHSVSADVGLWNKLGALLSRYAETDFAVTAERMADYQRLLYQTILDNSVAVDLSG